MNISGSGNKRKIRKNPKIYYKSEKRKSTSAFFRIIFRVLKFVLPVFLILYFTYFSGVFEIRDVEISGAENISREEILRYIPARSNILFFDSVEIQNKLMENISEIEKVSVYKGIPNAIKVVVKENSASLLWLSEGKYYLVNSDGEAYKEIVDLESYQALPKLNDNKNLPVTISSKVVSDRFINFVDKINKNLKTHVNYDPDFYYLEETTVDLYLKTKENIVIKFDTLRDPVQQLDNLKLVLMERKGEIKEYLDLRVNGWVYYK